MRKFVIVIYFLLDPIIMLVIKINYFLRKMTITFFNQIFFFIILVCSIYVTRDEPDATTRLTIYLYYRGKDLYRQIEINWRSL